MYLDAGRRVCMGNSSIPEGRTRYGEALGTKQRDISVVFCPNSAPGKILGDCPVYLGKQDCAAA